MKLPIGVFDFLAPLLTQPANQQISIPSALRFRLLPPLPYIIFAGRHESLR
jgi:hypothetical protein